MKTYLPSIKFVKYFQPDIILITKVYKARVLSIETEFVIL